MATVRDLFKDSLKIIGAIAAGETPTSTEMSDGLRVLNRMIGQWSTQNLLIFTRVREEFTLTPSDGSYTIGSTGDFNTSRPMEIEAATLEDQSSSPTLELPVNILTLEQWAAIGQKDLQSTYPTDLYFDDNYPLATINLWPVPTVANKLVLYSLKPLSNFATADDNVALPPGYEEAIVYNWAKRLAPEYGKAWSVENEDLAKKALGNIKRRNSKVQVMSCDPASLPMRPYWDWRTGGFR